jgi:23S rRNA (uracil1939-C5)-methyltransferase
MSAHLKPGCIQACPACPHRSLDMEESLNRKKQWLEKALGKFAEVLQPVNSVPEEKRWNYRRKVCLAAEYAGQAWNIGVRRRDTVIQIHDCPVQNHLINRNINLLSSLIPKPDEFPLAYFMQSGGQLVLVVKSRELPALAWLTEEIRDKLQRNSVKGFWIHTHPSTGKKILGKGGWHLIFGNPRSGNESGLVYGPQSFQQVLPELYEDSLHETEKFFSPCNDSAIIELYCGIGASLRKWIAAGAKTIGVELSGEAIECAGINAPQASLLRGKCAQRIPQLNTFIEDQKVAGEKILLYANPPRTGLEKEILTWIALKLKPPKMAYLSCSAGTLSRDLNFLDQHGLKTIRLIPYDFFPQTLHLEVFASIERAADK